MWLDRMPSFVLALLGVGLSMMAVGRLMQFGQLHRMPELIMGIGYSIMAVGVWIGLAGRLIASRKRQTPKPAPPAA